MSENFKDTNLAAPNAPFNPDEWVELFYQPSESLYGAAQKALLKNGWSIYPQTVYDRKPAKVEGDMVKWSQCIEKRVSGVRAEKWAAYCEPENVALVFGPASGNTFAIDIDVLDEELSENIKQLAFLHLGPTSLQRVGREPKLALIYRHAADDQVRSRSVMLTAKLDEEGQPQHGVEILGRGKSLTIHGCHHVTGKYFKWLDSTPSLVTPEEAPLVTSADVDSFMEALAEQIGIVKETSASATSTIDWGNANADGIRIPKMVSKEWVVDASTGKITDGRKKYIYMLAFRMVTAYGNDVKKADAEGTLNAITQRLIYAVYQTFIATAHIDGFDWTDSKAQQDAQVKVNAVVAKLLNGDITPSKRKLPGIFDNGNKVADASKKSVMDQLKPPFLPLGFQGKAYFFLSRNGQVLSFTARELCSEAGLIELAPLSWWKGEVRFINEEKHTINKTAAGDWLIEICQAQGFYSDGKVRGRGIHIGDENEVIAHLGDRLIVDGVAQEVGIYGPHAYPVAEKMPIKIGEPLSKERAKLLIDACGRWDFADQQASPTLLAGWIMSAMVCGAMTWRTHCWITGEAGTGKSQLLERVVNRMLPDGMSVNCSGTTSAAGIRQYLGLDSKPVKFDEAETQNESDAKRIQSILDLARQSSSEFAPDILKGTQDGTGTRSKLRSSFLASSINLGLVQRADLTRWIVLELSSRGENEARHARYLETCKLLEEWFAGDYCDALMSRAVNMVHAIRDSAKSFQTAIVSLGGDGRLGDTLGVPLAGAWCLQNDQAASRDDAEAYVAAHPWVLASLKRAHTDADWRQCLDYLLQQEIDVEDLAGKDPGARTLRMEIGAVLATNPALAEHKGIRECRGGFLIARNSAQVAKLMNGSTWGASWCSTIGRAPGATLKGTTRFTKFLVSSAALFVPRDLILVPDNHLVEAEHARS